MIDSNFEIDFVSDNKYKNITVEISYKKTNTLSVK